MSEHRYTTGELIGLLENFKVEPHEDWIVNVDADAIIARLRAADANVKFIEHIQGHLQPGQEVICKICGKSAKAIAEHEGKEE